MLSWVTGLSPRARGNAFAQALARIGIGAIPASAGERVLSAAPLPSQRGYPRERGGTWDPGALRWSELGLSPRARGNGVGPMMRLLMLGAIPASAGERRGRSGAILA